MTNLVLNLYIQPIHFISGLNNIDMNQHFKIGSRIIGYGYPVFIIAEIGINHGGDSNVCAQMIKAAADSGADAVKLQTVNAEESYVKGTASYNEFKTKELSDKSIKELINLSNELGIILFSTPGDFSSLQRIVKWGMPAIKISSGLMTNYPLIAEAAKTGLPLIISTGMALSSDIDKAIETVVKNDGKNNALLKCTSIYPSPDDAINLDAISTMIDRYKIPIGYSDHTLDDLACISAVAKGALIIEKHFTLDRNLPGADHAISMEPNDFVQMVKKTRRISSMLGSNKIGATEAELLVRTERHRCLIAKRTIQIGEQFSKENVGLMRPISGKEGLPADQFENVLGKIATDKIEKHEPINTNHFK
jgi:N,N'-diacetyllegionaminate synthase